MEEHGPCCDRAVEDGREILKEMERMGLVREIEPDVFEMTPHGEMVAAQRRMERLARASTKRPVA